MMAFDIILLTSFIFYVVGYIIIQLHKYSTEKVKLRFQPYHHSELYIVQVKVIWFWKTLQGGNIKNKFKIQELQSVKDNLETGKYYIKGFKIYTKTPDISRLEFTV